MTPTGEVLPALLEPLRALSRGEKIRVIQFLAEELAKEESVPHLESGASYPVWSPYGVEEAAALLQQLLAKEAAKP